MMKRTGILFTVMMVMVSLISACSSARFTFSGTGTAVRIEVNAPDGSYAESFDFSVGKNRYLVITPDLSEGELQIEFAEAIIITDPDSASQVSPGEVKRIVNVSGTEEITLTLPRNDYVMLVTAIGDTKGTVQLEIRKE